MSVDEDITEQPDQDEEVSELQTDKTRSSQLPKVLGVSEMPLSKRRYNQVRIVKEGEKTARDIYEEKLFQNDSLRKKYDLRNKNEKEINNIFLRAHIRKIKDRLKPNVEIKPIDSTTKE